MLTQPREIRLGWKLLKRVARPLFHVHIPVSDGLKPFFAGLYWSHVFAREGLAFCARVLWYEPLFRSQCKSVGKRFRMEQLPYLIGSGQITIGDGTTFSGKPSFGFNNRHLDAPLLAIGNECFIGHNCDISVGKEVAIGDRCLIAGGVRIADYDGHPLDASRRRAGETSSPAEIRPVRIGNDVWICAGALILKGVQIGDRAVVGARAVVTRDVPADSVVAGNPAGVVKKLSFEPADNPAGVAQHLSSNALSAALRTSETTR